jgi:hypothetical protein
MSVTMTPQKPSEQDEDPILVVMDQLMKKLSQDSSKLGKTALGSFSMWLSMHTLYNLMEDLFLIKRDLPLKEVRLHRPLMEMLMGYGDTVLEKLKDLDQSHLREMGVDCTSLETEIQYLRSKYIALYGTMTDEERKSMISEVFGGI